jgi:HK97 family phage portal protein
VSLLSKLFGRRGETPPEERAITSLNSIPKNSEQWAGGAAGIPVNDRTAMQHATVFACVRLIADSIAMLPLHAYRKVGGVRQEIDPTPSLISRPYPGMSQFEWVHQVVTSLVLRGNTFGVVTARDRLEYPTQILPVHPDDVVVEVQDMGLPRIPVYWVGGERVPIEDMVHIKRFTLPGDVEGLSPIRQAATGIGLSLAAEKYGARFFGDSANPSSVLESDQDLTEDQVTRTQKQWIASHGGRRHPAVLSGGFKWRPIAIMPEESQFLETRGYQRGEIAMLFGVPPHMIGDTQKSTSWGTGIEQQSIGYVTYTLGGWISCIEGALNMLTPRGTFVKFNVDGLLRGDQKSRYDAYTQARNAGWMNVDEIRSLEDMPPIPGGAGQSYIQPLNMGPLGTDPNANRPAPQPAPDPEEDEDQDQ